MANTTLCFAALDPFDARTTGFMVQVVGVDPDGKGIYYPNLDAALKYAYEANSNGFTCFVHLA